MKVFCESVLRKCTAKLIKQKENYGYKTQRKFKFWRSIFRNLLGNCMYWLKQLGLKWKLNVTTNSKKKLYKPNYYLSKETQ